MALNQWIGIGRITRQPELQTTQNGVSYCRFSIAVDRPYRKGEETKADFINVTAWRGSGEFVCNHFSKGEPIQVIGRIETGSYRDQEGNERPSFGVTAEKVDFVEGYRKPEAKDSIDESTRYDGGYGEDEDLPF